MNILSYFSNKLNARATVNMLTLRAMFNFESSTKTLACHIFQQEKDPYSAWLTGRDLIMEKIDEMDIKINRIVRVSHLPIKILSTVILELIEHYLFPYKL